MTEDDDRFLDDADRGYADLKEARAEEHFDRVREKSEAFAVAALGAVRRAATRSASAEPADYPVDDHSRHVLIVEQGGLAYVAPHLDLGQHDGEECARVVAAAKAFIGPTGIIPNRKPGRWWISADADGNAEIGGLVGSAS